MPEVHALPAPPRGERVVPCIDVPPVARRGPALYAGRPARSGRSWDWPRARRSLSRAVDSDPGRWAWAHRGYITLAVVVTWLLARGSTHYASSLDPPVPLAGRAPTGAERRWWSTASAHTEHLPGGHWAELESAMGAEAAAGARCVHARELGSLVSAAAVDGKVFRDLLLTHVPGATWAHVDHTSAPCGEPVQVRGWYADRVVLEGRAGPPVELRGPAAYCAQYMVAIDTGAAAPTCGR